MTPALAFLVAAAPDERTIFSDLNTVPSPPENVLNLPEFHHITYEQTSVLVVRKDGQEEMTVRGRRRDDWAEQHKREAEEYAHLQARVGPINNSFAGQAQKALTFGDEHAGIGLGGALAGEFKTIGGNAVPIISFQIMSK